MEIILKKLDELSRRIQEQNILDKDILTLREASSYLQLSRSSLYKMTHNKKIPHYVPGGKKIYFRKKELNEWIEKSRVSPTHELEGDIESYLSSNCKTLSI